MARHSAQAATEDWIVVSAQKSPPFSIQIAGVFIIWWQGVTAISRSICPRARKAAKRSRLISLTDTSAAAQEARVWKDLVSAAEASPAQELSDAEPVRRLVRLGAGEVVELKLAVRSEKPGAQHVREKATAFFRFEDAAGPIGFVAIEQFETDGLLHSLYLLEHRRGTGMGLELVAQVMQAAAALGVNRLWLLTETNAPFFEQAGFVRVERNTAPRPLAKSSEFSLPHREGAICMSSRVSKAPR
jgi:N-acetylglutamate synthase-like GNAT family acetyltransferase